MTPTPKDGLREDVKTQHARILTNFNDALIRGKTGLDEGCWDQLSDAVEAGIAAIRGDVGTAWSEGYDAGENTTRLGWKLRAEAAEAHADRFASVAAEMQERALAAEGEVKAAEERGAQAMRLICAESVGGLVIIPEPRRPDWIGENNGIRHAERLIRLLPLPRAYHGSAREAVAAALLPVPETQETRDV